MRTSLLRGAILAAFIFGPAVALYAQTSGHERVSVERRSPFALEVAGDFAFGRAVLADAEGASDENGDTATKTGEGKTETGSGGGENEALAFYGNLALNLLYQSRVSLNLSLPLSAALPLGRSDAGAPPCALGPPSLSLGYSERFGPWKLGAEVECKLGLGASTASRDPGLRPARYPALGLLLRAARFLDPLALGLSLRLETELERPEATGGVSSRPLSAGLCLFATEALNDKASLGFSLEQRLTGPRFLNGSPSGEAWDYELVPALSLSLARGEFLASFGLSGPESRASASLGLAYTFRLGGGASPLKAKPRGPIPGGLNPLSAE